MVDPEVITQHTSQSMRQVVLQAAAQGGRVSVRPTSISHQMDMEDHNQWMWAQSERARTRRREMERKGKKARKETVRRSMARVARTM